MRLFKRDRPIEEPESEVKAEEPPRRRSRDVGSFAEELSAYELPEAGDLGGEIR